MTEPDTHFSTLSQAAAAPHATRRAAWLLPAAILAGFALLFLGLFRDRLIPAKEVRVATAIALEEKITVSTAAAPANGKLLFQASGWIEPDPLPIKATALTDGVIDQVHVLEGQLVKKGDLLANLIEIDTRLARDNAAAELDMAKAIFTAHCTGIQANIARMEAESAALVSDEATAAEAADRLRRLESASIAASAEGERISARFASSRGQAAVDMRKARIAEINQDFSRLGHEAVSLQAKVHSAEIALEKAQLANDRTRVLAPADGRVLRLMASPGQKKMIAMDDEDSSTIAILYDPAHLQVRVDVPLADAAGLSVGQKAKVRCNLLPDKVFEGEVTRITGQADLQRNTLQAKVRIADPDEKLRPEMLCRVEFLDTASRSAAATSDATGLAVYIPDSAIQDSAVWICDPESHRINRRPVSVSTTTRENFHRIDQGVRPGEWVVLEPAKLSENQRVSPKMERGL